MTDPSEGERVPAADQALQFLLGGPPRYTRSEVADLAGTDLEFGRALWRALGFPDAAPDERVFGEGDLQALRAVGALFDNSDLSTDEAVVLARSMGRNLAALAAGQMEAMVAAYGYERITELGPALLAPLEQLVLHVWHRHLFAAAGRVTRVAQDGAAPMVVGFVDIVGYTARTRELEPTDLAALLERFDAAVHDCVVGHGGRVIKTIGDEVMWVADEPGRGAQCGLDLAETLHDPPVRVGLAYGATLASGGDHFGATVNLAARLTGLARPGTVLVDRQLAQALDAEAAFALVPLRPLHARGYEHLRATVLRRRS